VPVTAGDDALVAAASVAEVFALAGMKAVSWVQLARGVPWG